MIWILLDAVFVGDDEDDALSFQDKMILEDILRYGSFAEIQRRSGLSYYTLKDRLDQALTRLYNKLPTLEENCHLRQKLSESRTLIQKLREDLLEAQAKVVVIEPMLPSLKKENEALKSELELKKVDLHRANEMNSDIALKAKTYKTLFEESKQTIAKQEATIEKLKEDVKHRISDRELKLKERISSLQEMIKFLKQRR